MPLVLCMVTLTSTQHTCKTSRTFDGEHNDIDVVIKLWFEYCFNLININVIWVTGFLL